MNETNTSKYFPDGGLAFNVTRADGSRVARLRHGKRGCRYDPVSHRVVFLDADADASAGGGAGAAASEDLPELVLQRDVSAAILFVLVVMAYRFGLLRPRLLCT